MWAIESGIVSPEVEGDMVYYRFIKWGILPKEVDRMPSDKVESLLLIDSKIKEKREREMRFSQGTGGFGHSRRL